MIESRIWLSWDGSYSFRCLSQSGSFMKMSSLLREKSSKSKSIFDKQLCKTPQSPKLPPFILIKLYKIDNVVENCINKCNKYLSINTPKEMRSEEERLNFSGEFVNAILRLEDVDLATKVFQAWSPLDDVILEIFPDKVPPHLSTRKQVPIHVVAHILIQVIRNVKRTLHTTTILKINKTHMI